MQKKRKKHITVKNVRKTSGIKEYSDATINRYINKAVGKKKNRKHDSTTGKDVFWKKKLLPWQLIQIDIKYLTDIILRFKLLLGDLIQNKSTKKYNKLLNKYKQEYLRL